MCHQGASGQFVAQVKMNDAVLEQVGEEIRGGFCIHLAGMERHRAGKVYGADDDDAIFHDLLAWLSESAVATLFGSEVDDDGAWSHTPNHLFGDEHRGALAWNQRRWDDHVCSRHVSNHHLLLFLVTPPSALWHNHSWPPHHWFQDRGPR